MRVEEVLKRLNINPVSFDERKALINLSTTEIKLLEAIHKPLYAYENELIHAFYQHLLKFDHASKMLHDVNLMSKLQETQKLYFRKLTAGDYGFDYAQDRIRVGIAHQRVGLTPQWYIGAYGVYLDLVCKFVSVILNSDMERIEPTLTALYKVALLDITLAFDAYMYASHQTLEQSRQQISDKYDFQIRTSNAIAKIQRAFILNESYDSALSLLLNELIALTDSQFGLIGEVREDSQLRPYLKVRVLTNISWDHETRELYERSKADGLEFHNHHNLLGEVLTTGQAVISNNPQDDSRAGGTPHGHPKLSSFLGLPIKHNGKLIGMVGLANAANGYEQSDVEKLNPILETLESLSEAREIKNKLALTLEENARLALVATQTVNGVMILDCDYNITWCNAGFERISGYSLEELAGQSPWATLTGPQTNSFDLLKLQKAVAKKKSIEIELLKYRKSGETFWSRISCNPTFNELGEHSGYISVELDITQERLRQDELTSFKSVVDQIADAVLFFDAETLDILYANLAAQRQLGRSWAMLQIMKPYEFKPSYDAQSFDRLLKPLKMGEVELLHYVTQHRKGDGNIYPAEISMQIVQTAFNQKVVVNIIRDISAQRDYERLKSENEKRLVNLLHKSEDAMGIISPDFVITDCNDAAAKLFGLSDRKALIGLSPIQFSPLSQGKNNSEELAKVLLNKASTEGFQRFEWLHITKQGHHLPIEVTLTPVIYLGKNAIQVIWRDLSDIKAKEHRIKQLAFFDELTGLANKNLFSDRVKYLLKIAQRHQYTIAVVYIDLVNLEDINETMGYEAGDAVIQAVGRRLAKTIRGADTLVRCVFENEDCQTLPIVNDIDREFDSLARLNSDVFALAAVLSNPDAASIMVNRLQQALAEPLEILEGEVSINARAGIALYPQDADTFDAITRGANIALNMAKESGLPSCYFNIEVGERIQKKSIISKQLERTLLSYPDNLRIVLQPQVCLKTHKLVGAEVLVRWRDEELGEVSPGSFIPIAEERGLINKLTHLVLERVIELKRSWQKKEVFSQENLRFKLALNISAKSFDDESAIYGFLTLIELAGLEPNDFELELTETGLMRDPDKAISTLNMIRSKGFAIAIDDFGMGHSSLSYLKNINADVLKIDMHFIKSILEDEKNLAIVKTIISTAKIFGLKTLAEGIETQEIATLLAELGCDWGQGYYFDKPLSVEQFEKLLLSYKREY